MKKSNDWSYFIYNVSLSYCYDSCINSIYIIPSIKNVASNIVPHQSPT
eukprot:UN07303